MLLIFIYIALNLNKSLLKIYMQVYEKDIYNKINQYYDISEKIKEEIFKLNDIDDDIKFNILMPVVDEITKTADTLMEKYIDLLKNKNNLSLKNELISILDKFLEYIHIYKNKLYEIYKDK